MPNQQFYKTRIAPTPSGFLHVGNVLSFAITAALAKKTGAKILLRIDDLDRERVNSLYVQDIFDTMNFMEIPWDEGPRNYSEYEKEWSQIHRMPMYNEALQHLKDTGAVFACNCSRAQIRHINSDDSYPATCLNKAVPFDEERVSWRLKTDEAQTVNIKLLGGDTVTAHLPKNMQHFVVRRKDDYPAYQLSSVLDDVFYGIDLIVRGQDLWDSTFAQHYLAPHIRADVFTDITFHHHSLLMASATEKLSKSAGATSISYLRNSRKSAADIYTMIAGMPGVNEPVKDWEGLARLVLPPV